MPIDNFYSLLKEDVSDASVINRLVHVWPFIKTILQSFSKATCLPIFVYINQTFVWRSSPDTMPEYCQVMLEDENMLNRCLDDGRRRAIGDEDEVSPGIQMCHAGMLNRRTIFHLPGIGSFTISYGSKYVVSDLAIERRIKILEKCDPEFANKYNRSLPTDTVDIAFDEDSISLIDAISSVVEQLLKALVGLHWAAINMAHELSYLLLGMGFMAQDIEESLREDSTLPNFDEIYTPVLRECQLGIYIVRNYLSYVSETRYSEAKQKRFSKIILFDILSDLIRLHAKSADAKDIDIELDSDLMIPNIYGDEIEIRRAIHNVLSNAIKYSYHSTDKANRKIRIGAKVPYNPGFSNKRMFSIVFENYGLGITENERSKIGTAGFRGAQAINEVPIGSGIGLFEVSKIMKQHDGWFKLKSIPLHKNDTGQVTYLTIVDLVFPLERKRESYEQR